MGSHQPDTFVQYIQHISPVHAADQFSICNTSAHTMGRYILNPEDALRYVIKVPWSGGAGGVRAMIKEE